jgi:tRNA threonylcarbamoyladenosine biosynthesis protein TsaE
MSELLITVDDLAATEAFGRRLGRLLFPGAVVALIGPLGAGKTHLARAIAEGLDIADRRAVSSPTFVLIQEYDARLPIYHFDAYRLPGPSEFVALGVDEYFSGKGVCLVEWADRVAAALPADHLRIGIRVIGESTRELHIAGHGERHAAIVKKLRHETNS